jgi:glycerol-3-phosphate O-acyltransferase
VRRFRGSGRSSGRFVARWVWRRLTGRIRRFGFATVSYGAPLPIGPDDRDPEAVGARLMDRLRAAVPVLPIPLACLVLIRAEGPLTEAAFHRETEDLAALLAHRGARLCLDAPASQMPPLDMLRLRRMVRDGAGGIAIAEEKRPLVAFYAASIAHHLDSHAAAQEAVGRAAAIPT